MVPDPGILLQAFIKNKVAQYCEPARRRRSKGELIDFSKRKYRASLMVLTSKSLKQIAESENTSYAVLRRWMTEAPFKKRVQEHSQQFASLLLAFCGDRPIHKIGSKPFMINCPPGSGETALMLSHRLIEVTLGRAKIELEAEMKKPDPSIRRLRSLTRLCSTFVVGPGEGKSHGLFLAKFISELLSSTSDQSIYNMDTLRKHFPHDDEAAKRAFLQLALIKGLLNPEGHDQNWVARNGDSERRFS